MMDSVEVNIKIRDLNPHVVCSLCAGYFVDATTITECLHTFCKSCIVKYLQSSKYCPTCNLKIHETQPLINLRLDRTMEDVVHKVVPGIFGDEGRRRREFYESRGMAVESRAPSILDENETDASTSKSTKHDFSEIRNLYRDDELISLCIERYCPLEEQEESQVQTLSKKYLRCSSRMMILHLEKFLRQKLNIPEDKEVEILCNDQVILPRRTMRFVWISQWWTVVSKGHPSCFTIGYEIHQMNSCMQP